VAGATLGGDESLELPELDDPPADPLPLVRDWLDRAERRGVREPGAFVLGTADADGRPSARVLLVKAVDGRGLVFTTHAGSRKGRDLAATGWATAVFHWRETNQQVVLAGRAEALPPAESDALFAERPRAARATTVASRQSEPLPDPAALRAEAERLAAGAEPLARPPGWGGYRLVPDRVELWHGRSDRLHRRLEYRLVAGRWAARRLQP
jgi:dihydrophenazinedicarboxylate synthase